MSFDAFPQLEARKVSSTNVLKRLNREIRRRTGAVGIFPSADAYTQTDYHLPHGIGGRLVHLQSVHQ